MGALHEAGKLHRDIKPSNVMVTAAGRVVLMDFGLVTDVSPMSISFEPVRAIVGTIAYISPEQAAGRPATEASDWYSVGVMIYNVLTGQLPFDGSPTTVLQRKQMEDPAPPSALCSDIPQDLNELCVALLARDPARRPRGQDILEQLGQDRTEPSHGRRSRATRTAMLVGRESHREDFEAAYRAVPRASRSCCWSRADPVRARALWFSRSWTAWKNGAKPSYSLGVATNASRSPTRLWTT